MFGHSIISKVNFVNYKSAFFLISTKYEEVRKNRYKYIFQDMYMMNYDGLISHIEINVFDLEKSFEFYSFVLGFMGYKIFQNWDKGKSWKKWNTYIVIVQTEKKYLDHMFNRRNIGLNHLAFYAPSKEKVDKLREDLKNRGVHLLYEGRFPNAGGEDEYSLFFEDPDRIKLEYVFNK